MGIQNSVKLAETMLIMENKELPKNTDAERLVLGTIMSDKNALSEVRDLLTEDCFYDDFHKEMFKTIKAIDSRGDRPDIVMVSNEMGKNKDFDLVRFLETTQSFSFDIYQHAAILHDKSKRRKFFEIGQYLLSNTFSETEDIADVLSKANDMISGVLQSSVENICTISDAIREVYKQIDKNVAGTTKLTGTPTGFKDFDKKAGGLQKSDLIIIAAETSQGKTSLALSIVGNAALEGSKLAIYSLEMIKEQLAARLMSMESGIPPNEILYSRLQSMRFEQLDKSIGKIRDTSIFFDDRSTSNIDTIIASIRTMVLKYGIEGVVIDYLQILNVNMKGFNKEQQMADVARRLKNLAKELNIWIIALSQLNRDFNNPVPNLNRLRDSGQIAEAADIVIFIYRPEYYGKSYPEPFQKFNPKDTAMIDVAKGRNIGLMKFVCLFDKTTTRFKDLDFSGDYVNYYEKEMDPF
jgi:replicative DNA helicase